MLATDKGLVGALNTNLFRKVDEFVHDQKTKTRETSFIAVGKKAANYVRKSGCELVHEFEALDDVFYPADLVELSEKMCGLYTKGPFDKVIMAYTNFYSTLSQKPFIRGILPLTYEKIEELGDVQEEIIEKLKSLPTTGYLFEPDKQVVLNKLLPRLVTTLVYHDLLEATASEHSARMVAMKSASDNASELIDELTLKYNRLRQEGITKELAEISAGAGSLN